MQQQIIRLFTGFDPREEVGYHVFCSSVIQHASEPVAFIPLHGQQRDGTNAFTYVRFEVPRLCNHEGWAIFADGCDMLCRTDIAELWKLRNDRMALHVVKHDYLTRHPRKYIGTEMEAANRMYPRKNWSSLMLMNCAHPAWQEADPTGSSPHRFAWIPDHEIGSLPVEWNWMPQEQGVNPQAKLLHFTAGIPAFPHYRETEMAGVWHAQATYAHQ